MKIYAADYAEASEPCTIEDTNDIFRRISGKDIWVKVDDFKGWGNEGWLQVLECAPTFYYRYVLNAYLDDKDQFGLKISQHVRNGYPTGLRVVDPVQTLTTAELQLKILGNPNPAQTISDDFSKYVGKPVWVRCYDGAYTDFSFIRIVSVDSDKVTYYNLPENIINCRPSYGDEFVINVWNKRCPISSPIGFFNKYYTLVTPVDVYSDDEIDEFCNIVLDQLESEEL